MTQSFSCVGCAKRFSTSKALSCHIGSKQQCRRNWHKFLATLDTQTPSPFAYTRNLPGEKDLNVDEDGNELDPALDEPDSGDSLADISEEEMMPVPPEIIEMDFQAMDWTLEHRVDSVNQSTPVASRLPRAGAMAKESAPLTYEEVYPEAGSVFGTTTPPFAKTPSQEQMHENNPYFPFSGFRDWQLASWIQESGLPMSQIDKFLHLDYVRTPH
jgi:hypothetical protein